MPYITQAERKNLDENIDNLVEDIKTEGQLNYCIYRIMIRKMWDWSLCYSTLNKLIGVFECCKAEFQRKFVVPYEESKIRENGDIR